MNDHQSLLLTQRLQNPAYRLSGIIIFKKTLMAEAQQITKHRLNQKYYFSPCLG